MKTYAIKRVSLIIPEQRILRKSISERTRKNLRISRVGSVCQRKIKSVSTVHDRIYEYVNILPRKHFIGTIHFSLFLSLLLPFFPLFYFGIILSQINIKRGKSLLLISLKMYTFSLSLILILHVQHIYRKVEYYMYIEMLELKFPCV